MKTWNWVVWAVGLVAVGCGADADVAGAPADSEGGTANEEITNNQEEGVDEGGIVKNIGDYLVVLRQGRLYAVDVAESGNVTQTDVEDVPIPDLPTQEWGAWYDEMLVNGDDIYVVGYRYDVELEDSPGSWSGATEINHFVLNVDDGQLERRETLFFESSDYYDWSNYSSRMIGDKVVFYMPYYHRVTPLAFSYPHLAARGLPTMLEHRGGNRFRRMAPLLASGDIVKGRGDALHTIVTCELTSGVVKTCEGKAMRGDWWGQRYVTADDVYLWSNDRIYAMSLQDGSVTSHEARGWPRDQFSFDFDGENLNVVVMDTADRRSDLFMLALPREEFTEDGGKLESRHLRRLESDTDVWIQANRFVDGHLLVAVETWNPDRVGNDNLVIAYDVKNDERHLLPLVDPVTRIEPMRGVGALVVTNSWQEPRTELHSVVLGDEPRVVDSFRFEATRESEWRSHGFFFKPDDELGGGRFGLPVISINGGGWWGTEPASIAFFDVTPAADMSLLGTVGASLANNDESTCEISCYDWYGNTRPIFLRDRVYGLIGSEIIEVGFDDGVREVQRVALVAEL